jgi:hypothetical protein
MSSIVLNQNIDSRHHLRIFKSDIGVHFELLRDGKLAIGTYFLYGEKIHKAACCLGGAIYGLLHDDELTEDVMRVIEDNEALLGGYELKR